MKKRYKILYVGEGKYQTEHKYVWEQEYGEVPDGMEIDHINGDTMDNRLENLRLATHQQNQRNRKGANKNNKSTGARNVYLQTSGNYMVLFTMNKQNKYFGTYEDLELADFIAQEVRNKYFGEFA